MNFKKIFFNLSYAVTSNLITLVVSLLTSLVIPKIIGVEAYGYWQLYLFYSLFVGFLHFGWCDGIYLRYGGKSYAALNYRSLSSQFYLLLIIQLFFAVVLFTATINLNINTDRRYVINMVAFYLLATNMRWMLVFILQATNRIKDFAKVMILDRLLYIVLLLLILLFGYRGFKLMLVVDVVAKTSSLFYAAILVKEITTPVFKNFIFDFNDIYANLRAGIKLMFANIASLLMMGIIRLGVERTWDIKTFGKISLTLSAAKLMMVFINAVGIVIYPILRRMNPNRLAQTYSTIRDVLSPGLLGLLILFYPLELFLVNWLPAYEEGLVYLVFVFPICFFEGKMALLINTYYKVLRKEKLLLIINVLSFLLSAGLTFIFTVINKNLDHLMASVVVVMAFRSILAEMLLRRFLKVKVVKELVIELLLISLFVTSGWFLKSVYAPAFFFLAYVLYLLAERKKIFSAYRIVQNMRNKNK